MRCTIYAQISGLVQEAKVISEFPQWGSNSKEALYRVQKQSIGFSPRNGEVILKSILPYYALALACFSPRNGEVILKLGTLLQRVANLEFQSPQWGSNSKELYLLI